MRSPLIQTAAQAFMDKLVGDWGVTGTYEDLSGTGEILGESSVIKQTSISNRIKETGALVVTPYRKGKGFEGNFESYLSEDATGINLYRTFDGLTDKAKLTFLNPNTLLGSVDYRPSGLRREFTIARESDSPNHFNITIIAHKQDGRLMEEQRLLYQRIKYGPVQK